MELRKSPIKTHPDSPDEPLDGDTQRTLLAAERTWLAWWRSAVAVAATAVAVGALIPRVVDGSRTPFVLLGAGYALLSAAVFVGAAGRQRSVRKELVHGTAVEVNLRWVMGLTGAGIALSIATLIVILIEA